MKIKHERFIFLAICVCLVHPAQAEGDALAKEVGDVLPSTFSGPIFKNNKAKTTSHTWLEIKGQGSCKVALLASKTALPMNNNANIGAKILAALFDEEKGNYQTISNVKTSPNLEHQGSLEAQWTGMRNWQDATEVIIGVHRYPELAFVEIECLGEGSLQRVELLRVQIKQRLAINE